MFVKVVFSILHLDPYHLSSYNKKRLLVYGGIDMSEISESSEKQQEKNPHFTEAHEHMRTARENMRKSIKALLPPGYMEHRRAARKEMLLAMRSLVDAAIDRVEKHSDKN